MTAGISHSPSVPPDDATVVTMVDNGEAALEVEMALDAAQFGFDYQLVASGHGVYTYALTGDGVSAFLEHYDLEADD